MNREDLYSAYDAFAPFYDLAELDREPEIAFYAGLVRPGDDALIELGCGTGKIVAGVVAALGEARRPRRVVGLDQSARLLDVARRRAPEIEWVHGDMTAPRISGPFGLVLCPFNTLQLLPSADAVLATFAAVRGLLARGGRFAFDLYNASYVEPEPEKSAPDERRDHLAREFVDGAGRTLQIREDVAQDPQGRHVTLDWRVVDAAAGATIATLNLTLRHYGAEDIERLLERAGLRILDRFGNVRGAPFSREGSKKQVVVCGRDVDVA